MLAESNFVLGGAVALGDKIRDSFAGRVIDESFVAEDHLKASAIAPSLSDREKSYLSGSGNYDQYLTRLKEIVRERDRMEAVADMSFGSQMFWGLAGGVTDPASYIPIAGWAGRASSAAKTFGNAAKVVRAGGEASVKNLMVSQSAKTGFWVNAVDGAVLETALQGVLISSAINKEDRAEGVGYSIALTGAFSGIFGGALGAARGASQARSISRGASESSLPEYLVKIGAEPDLASASRTASVIESRDPSWLSPSTPTSLAHSSAQGVKAVAGKVGGLRKKLNAELKKAEPDEAAVSRLEQEIELAKAKPESGTEAAEIQAAQLANKPRKGVAAATPDSVSGLGSVRSILEKSAPERWAEFSQYVADAENGMATWPSFIRYMLGNGNARLLMNKGPISLMYTPRGGGDAKARSIQIRKVTPSIRKKMRGNPAMYDAGYVFLDFEGAEKMFADNDVTFWVASGGYDDLKGAAASLKRMSPRDVANNSEEFIDFLVMHEISHGLEPNQKVWDAGLAESQAKKLDEGLTNQQALAWREGIQQKGPDERPDVSFFETDGMTPMNNSVPLGPREDPVHALKVNYASQGWKRSAQNALVKWGRWTSPIVRGATSPSKALRTFQAHLIDSPFYMTTGGPSGGTAQQRVGLKYADPVRRVRRESVEAWTKVSDSLEPGERIEFADFDARVHRAIAMENGDTIGDAYGKAVNDSAASYFKVNESLRAEGERFGFEEMEFPEGERYYRRLYDNNQVKTDAFIDMLQANGITRESALKIQRAIMASGSRIGSLDSRIIQSRGVLEGRGVEMGMIEYDQLAPFLNTSAFETELNMAKSMGGEVELRRSLAEAADELGIKNVLSEKVSVDPETGEGTAVAVFNWEPIKDALKREFVLLKQNGGVGLTKDNVSAAYEADWGTGSELASRYPNDAARLGQFKDEILLTGMDMKQLDSEAAFAEKWFEQMVSTLQNTRDITAHPDSWMEARLPALIKNATHTIVGGALAISNVADFHRSVVEYGFTRTFKNEWSLWIKDLEGWQKRTEMTEAIGLALEDQKAEVQRNLRNVNEHYIPETKVEQLAEKGASLMSRLNMMDRVANTHQKAFSSGTQSFLIDSIPRFLAGELGEADIARLKRLGVNKQSAKSIQKAFDEGAKKVTDRGTAYVEPWEGDSFTTFAAAVRKGVYITQTVPSRAELFDFQVQGMTSLLFMYRNWTMAANNRLLSATLSNRDSALMAGAIASIGLGAMVTVAREAINGSSENLPWNDPEQFLRRSIDNGGYLGLVGEANNLVSRITDGHVDLNPVGEGGMRYYDSTTAYAAVAGPVWLYPNYAMKTGAKVFSPTELDRYDVERTRNVLPFMNLFYIDGLWNNLIKDLGNGPTDD